MKHQWSGLLNVGVVLFLLLVGAHALPAADLKQLIDKELISQDAVDALCQAQAQGYVVKILFNNERQTIVALLGESHHCNSANTAKAGKKAMRMFGLVGVEGSVPTNCPTYAFDFISKLCFCCFNSADACARTKGSLTDTALESSAIENSPLLLESYEIQAEDWGQIVHLEEGHEPDCAENVISLLIPTTYCLPAACLITYFCAPSPVFLGVSFATLASAAYLISGGCGYFLEEYLPLSWPTGWTRWVGIYGITAHRNETMAANTDRALKKLTHHKAMADIMGLLHIAGTNRLLRKLYGYESVELNEIETEP